MDQFYKEARNLSSHLNNLSRDYRADGWTEISKDLYEASLTIRILLNKIEMMRHNIRKLEE